MPSRRVRTIVLGLGVAEAQEGLAGQSLLQDLPGSVPAPQACDWLHVEGQLQASRSAPCSSGGRAHGLPASA